MSSANQSLEQHPICDNRRESASKLANKMRKRGVKWPKCRSKLVLMASLVGVLLLVSGLFVHLSGFSDENNENDDLKYGGEWRVILLRVPLALRTLANRMSQR